MSSFSSITSFLDSHKYRYTTYDGVEKVTLSLAGKHADYRVEMRMTHEGEFFQINIHYPFRIRDEEQRRSVAELLARANYGILVGHFELDMHDGETRFHVTHLVQGLPLTPETVERLLYTGLSSMDRYLPALMQHLHAGHTPEDAVYLAEIDIHAQIVEDKPASKAQHPSKAKPEKEPKQQRPKKPSRKKNPGEGGAQGDLPLE